MDPNEKSPLFLLSSSLAPRVRVRVRVIGPFLSECELRYSSGSLSFLTVVFSTSHTAMELKTNLDPRDLTQLSYSSSPLAPLCTTNITMSLRKAVSSSDLPTNLSFTVNFAFEHSGLTRHAVIWMRPSADRCRLHAAKPLPTTSATSPSDSIVKVRSSVRTQRSAPPGSGFVYSNTLAPISKIHIHPRYLIRVCISTPAHPRCTQSLCLGLVNMIPHKGSFTLLAAPL